MAERVEAFIQRWLGREGGQERANYGPFLIELCQALDLPPLDPAGATIENNDYVLERAVKEVARDGAVTTKRIDLYKRDCFILEAKQSRLSGDKQVGQGSLALVDENTVARGRRGADRRWDALMHNARRQAEDYVRLLPADHQPPPFILVCDVGHCIEVYANFRRDGKAYDQFPDRRGFRIHLEDLRDAGTRERLRLIWTDPMALDPARHAAIVTRAIAARLAKVSKALEESGHAAEEVAMFLMRLLFTMFAEDVELLPKDCFKALLADCLEDPKIFPAMMEDLWRAMDEGAFTATIRQRVRRFNGEFFKKRKALPLGREEIGELVAAAARDWREVEPAIFGALLEQALDKDERRRLGAHYTPRAYVERLVVATIIDPLRAEWADVLATADRQNAEGRAKDAAETVRAFLGRLCETRVLDPACGTGNFLYVALELMRRLEGEVLEALSSLGGQEGLGGMAGSTVDPHQFLGLEINPRAAAIAEMVLWIGYLQAHLRSKGGAPGEPILKAFHNIKVMDAVLAWDGQPVPKVVNGVEICPNPRRPDWPEAEYIVGNPPFIGGKDLRARLGDGVAAALWAAHPKMNDSADFVMYWWDHAAGLLTAKDTKLRRFGFVTTNSITQEFSRRTIARHLGGKQPISLIMAIPDHPWTKATRDTAAVRIAMTVAVAGGAPGILREVTRESGLDGDQPVIETSEVEGTINADLTVGADVTAANGLLANLGVCSPGVKLHGDGFIVTPADAIALGLGRRPGLEKHIRAYRNGRDLTSHARDVLVIDLLGLDAEAVRRRFPEVYQHLVTTVKPERDANNRKTYRDNWWIFGEPRRELRPALVGLPRYISTVETSKHRVFQFLDAAILPDNKLVCIGASDAWVLGVLTSRWHVDWALRAGGWLGVGNDSVYVKSKCFDPFPFPDATEAQKAKIRALAEELDALRKQVLADHPQLTLTQLYNVREALKAGVALTFEEERIKRDGLVLVLAELHDRIDAAVAEAYGWPVDLPEAELLNRLVALNAARAKEEGEGLVRWLRPEYQIPRFGSESDKARQFEADLGAPVAAAAPGARPAFPKGDLEQTIAVMAALARADGPRDAASLATGFKPGRGVAPAIAKVLLALHRMGEIATTDGGRSFSLRRAA